MHHFIVARLGRRPRAFDQKACRFTSVPPTSTRLRPTAVDTTPSSAAHRPLRGPALPGAAPAARDQSLRINGLKGLLKSPVSILRVGQVWSVGMAQVLPFKPVAERPLAAAPGKPYLGDILVRAGPPRARRRWPPRSTSSRTRTRPRPDPPRRRADHPGGADRRAERAGEDRARRPRRPPRGPVAGGDGRSLPVPRTRGRAVARPWRPPGDRRRKSVARGRGARGLRRRGARARARRRRSADGGAAVRARPWSATPKRAARPG